MKLAPQLGSLVATGRLATVHRGVLGGRAVAVKRARPEVAGAAAALRRETRILRAITHPALVPVLDLVDHPEAPALVLGWADGGSLTDLLADGPVTGDVVLHLVWPLAAALDALHRAGVAHLDVSPGNVLLAAAGPLLIDPAPPGAGTPGYADPSVAAGAPPSARSDVYGLAGCAHVALTGLHPGAGGGLAPGLVLPPALATALAAGLHPDPRQRPASPSRLVHQLERALRPRTQAPSRRSLGPSGLAERVAEGPSGPAEGVAEGPSGLGEGFAGISGGLGEQVPGSSGRPVGSLAERPGGPVGRVAESPGGPVGPMAGSPSAPVGRAAGSSDGSAPGSTQGRIPRGVPRGGTGGGAAAGGAACDGGPHLRAAAEPKERGGRGAAGALARPVVRERASASHPPRTWPFDRWQEEADAAAARAAQVAGPSPRPRRRSRRILLAVVLVVTALAALSAASLSRRTPPTAPFIGRSSASDSTPHPPATRPPPTTTPGGSP